MEPIGKKCVFSVLNMFSKERETNHINMIDITKQYSIYSDIL